MTQKDKGYCIPWQPPAGASGPHIEKSFMNAAGSCASKYDWWTGEKQAGGRSITRAVDLPIMPIYVRAGAIIPVDPIRQYTAQKVDSPTTLRIYPGADGDFTLYDDDGIRQDYLKGKSSRIHITFNNRNKKLVMEPGIGKQEIIQREFNILLLPQGTQQLVNYKGSRLEIVLK